MNDIIKNLFNKYDESKKNFKELFDIKNKKYNISMEEIDYDGVLNFNDEFTLECFFLGSYNHNEKVWIWGWCYPLSRNNIQLGKKLVNYALNFEKDKLNREDFGYIRTILINSRIQIDEDFNLELIQGLILYLTNSKVIIPLKENINGSNISYFYGIENPSKKIY